MNYPARILIVEDDMIIGANLSLQLTKLGYEVTGIESRGEAAISNVKEHIPDLLLLDINLKGSLDGIETAKAIRKYVDLPIIYLTANTDDATFEKAKETHPKAFITKPFNRLNLQRTIALVLEQPKEGSGTGRLHLDIEVLSDRFFVRHHGKMEKLLFDEILYIEADRNYSTIFTAKGNYVLTSTLKTMEERLPTTQFVRVHRSYMVNLSNVDIVADHHLEIGRTVIPLSKSHKEVFMSRIQLI
ncbi:response regulator transcription factor [Flavobacteriaceae bacterium TP-CH-4]|uniref:Response regulator transcription factor n=1 Tax=Pelagihabitans pacificus TaxID=2696054 RepID=A0A967E5I1_9FLAO|nr:response regulator [Pelagihabitans pacificus]NHF59462.1 response regulator transcription factor [Pelagihabitans pacificus]